MCSHIKCGYGLNNQRVLSCTAKIDEKPNRVRPNIELRDKVMYIRQRYYIWGQKLIKHTENRQHH